MASYHQFQIAITFANVIPFIQIHVSKSEMIMKNSFIFYYIFCKTIQPFPNKCKLLSTKFCEHFYYKGEDIKVSSIIFDAYFNLLYINVA